MNLYESIEAANAERPEVVKGEKPGRIYHIHDGDDNHFVWGPAPREVLVEYGEEYKSLTCHLAGKVDPFAEMEAVICEAEAKKNPTKYDKMFVAKLRESLAALKAAGTKSKARPKTAADKDLPGQTVSPPDVDAPPDDTQDDLPGEAAAGTAEDAEQVATESKEAQPGDLGSAEEF